MTYNPLDFRKDRPSYLDEEVTKLRNLVKQHKVCWEVWPEYHIDREGKKVQIGFELDLIGTHDHQEEIVEPGCSECIQIYEDLKRIGQWIIPREEGDSYYEIGVFDASIHYASQRRFRPDVLLTIKILHREGFDRPTNACEVKCLNEMEEKLKELGAFKGSWPGGFRRTPY